MISTIRWTTAITLAVFVWGGTAWNPVVAQEPGAREAAVLSARTLRIKPRYYRWLVDPGKAWIEKNTGYAHLDWEIPLERVGLVLVDVWDRHYLEDPETRAETIIQQKIRPLLTACRRAGVEIIHAPSPTQARACPGWVGRSRPEPVAPAPCSASCPIAASEPQWPPAEFRGKSGSFRQYAPPVDPQAAVRDQRRQGLAMHPDVLPQGNEAVVATGDELHDYCRKKGILFLFYVGFNTNACILVRDYGTLEMGKRGYEVIILRDCTTGMESFETTEELWQTRGAVLFLEMFGKYSTTSEDFTAGLPQPLG